MESIIENKFKIGEKVNALYARHAYTIYWGTIESIRSIKDEIHYEILIRNEQGREEKRTFPERDVFKLKTIDIHISK